MIRRGHVVLRLKAFPCNLKRKADHLATIIYRPVSIISIDIVIKMSIDDTVICIFCIYCLTFLQDEWIIINCSLCLYDVSLVDNGSYMMPADTDRYDVWLSVKSTRDNSASIIIYSYEDHECVSAKVVLRPTVDNT